MHELSIAHALVGTVSRVVGDEQVLEVHVRIGALAGVVPAALQFAWDVSCAGTALAGSILVITWVPALVHCPACQVAAPIEGALVLACPSCGTPTGDIRGGRELLVTHVVLEDEPVGARA